MLDNCSDDGSADEIPASFPEVNLIAQSFRAGFGANHNRVIAATSGTYVFLLNDDAEIRPEDLDVLADYLDQHPTVAAVAPRIRTPAGAVQQTAWRFLTPRRAVIYGLTLGQIGVDESATETEKRVDRVSGCAVLLRRSALEEVGGFDERFFMYSEDSDLCLRMSKLGLEIHYLPTVSVVHHSQQSSAATPWRRVHEHWRSQHLYWRKHHSRLGRRVAALAMGFSLAVRAALGFLLGLLPARVRPERATNWPPEEFWLSARDAWFGPRGPGLRELADEWNATAARHP